MPSTSADTTAGGNAAFATAPDSTAVGFLATAGDLNATATDPSAKPARAVRSRWVRDRWPIVVATVSVGNANLQRQIVRVLLWPQSTDAVNVAQLNTAMTDAVFNAISTSGGRRHQR